MDIEKLRYPVGPLPRTPDPLDEPTRAAHIAVIADAPGRFRSLVRGITEAQLEASYRPDGWTVRQLVSSHSRQPHERVHPHEARGHRGVADRQDLRRGAPGGAAGGEARAN